MASGPSIRLPSAGRNARKGAGPRSGSPDERRAVIRDQTEEFFAAGGKVTTVGIIVGDSDGQFGKNRGRGRVVKPRMWNPAGGDVLGY